MKLLKQLFCKHNYITSTHTTYRLLSTMIGLVKCSMLRSVLSVVKRRLLVRFNEGGKI